MVDFIIKYWIQWLFGLLIAALGAYTKYLSGVIKREKAEQKALRDGMRSLLRRQIIMDCEGAIKEQYCPTATKDTIEDMYQSYHALGGNGVVTSIKDQMMALPTVKGEHHD